MFIAILDSWSSSSTILVHKRASSPPLILDTPLIQTHFLYHYHYSAHPQTLQSHSYWLKSHHTMYINAVTLILAVVFLPCVVDDVIFQSASKKEHLRQRLEQCRQSEERLSPRERRCLQREEEVSKAEEGIRRRGEQVNLREAPTDQGSGQASTWKERLDQMRRSVGPFNGLDQGARRPATPENHHDMESDDDGRRRLAQEEAASMACIWYCPRCSCPYIKIEGCNAVKCRCTSKITSLHKRSSH